MGYYMNIISSDVSIPKENLDEAYKRMCALNFVPGIKVGRYPRKENQSEPNPNSWFAWMDWNYHETCKNAKEILQALRFDVEYNQNGDLEICSFSDKCGNENLFLAAIADLMSGTMVMTKASLASLWAGEEWERWKSEYTLGQPSKEFEGVIVWTEVQKEK